MKKILEGNNYHHPNYGIDDCCCCGDHKRTSMLEIFLQNDGYDVEAACDTLDMDPCEVICPACYKDLKPELDSALYSEYNDLGTDTRTGEPFGSAISESKKKVVESIQAYAGNAMSMKMAIERYFEESDLDVDVVDYSFGNSWKVFWDFECTGEDFKYIDDEMLKSYIEERSAFADVELEVFSHNGKIEVSVVGSEELEENKMKMKEGNSVSGTLPPSLDSYLQDVAQMFGGIDYTDITKFGKVATEADVQKLKALCRKAKEAAKYDDEDDMSEIAKKAASLVRAALSESTSKKEKKVVKEGEQKATLIGRIVPDDKPRKTIWLDGPVLDLSNNLKVKEAIEKIYRDLEAIDIRAEDIICTDPATHQFEMVIEGDWKHDHGDADHLMWEKYHLSCVRTQIIGDSDEDWYTARHEYRHTGLARGQKYDESKKAKKGLKEDKYQSIDDELNAIENGGWDAFDNSDLADPIMADRIHQNASFEGRSDLDYINHEDLLDDIEDDFAYEIEDGGNVNYAETPFRGFKDIFDEMKAELDANGEVDGSYGGTVTSTEDLVNYVLEMEIDAIYEEWGIRLPSVSNYPYSTMEEALKHLAPYANDTYPNCKGFFETLMNISKEYNAAVTELNLDWPPLIKIPVKESKKVSNKRMDEMGRLANAHKAADLSSVANSEKGKASSKAKVVARSIYEAVDEFCNEVNEDSKTKLYAFIKHDDNEHLIKKGIHWSVGFTDNLEGPEEFLVSFGIADPTGSQYSIGENSFFEFENYSPCARPVNWDEPLTTKMDDDPMSITSEDLWECLENDTVFMNYLMTGELDPDYDPETGEYMD